VGAAIGPVGSFSHLRPAGKGQHGIEVEGLARRFKDVRFIEGEPTQVGA
jgi:hypothetical protein